MRRLKKNAARRRRFRQMVEPIEPRMMLSGAPAAVISGDVLTVTGSVAADVIDIQYDVEDENMAVNPVETFTVSVNGAAQTLTSSAVTSLVVNSGPGNDSISVSGYALSRTVVSVQINAGNGDDTINTSDDPGASTKTMVAVGDGNDFIDIVAGASASVTAGNGNDSIEIDETNLAAITAGNGNDAFEAGLTGAASTVNLTVTAGTGDDQFYNEDPDNSLTATAAGGPTFTVSNFSTSVTGRAYIDNNRDGVYDTGDALLPGTRVYVDANNDGVYDAGETAATTSAQGYYAISNIENGLTGGTTEPGRVVMPLLLVAPPAGYSAVPEAPELTIDTGSSSVDLAVVPSRLTGTVIGTSGSYQNDGNTIANAFDGKLSTFADGPAANGNNAGLDLGSAKSISTISFAPRSGFAGRMVGGIFQGSNSPNFGNAVNLDTITATPAAGVLTTVKSTNATAFRYVRYLSPGGSYGDVAEIEFFSATAGGAIAVHLFDDTSGYGAAFGGENLTGFGAYLDLNNNGVFDGADIRLFSNGAGDITFQGLPAGTYTLRQNVPAGYIVTTPVAGFPIKVSVSGQTTTVLNVGERQAQKLTGTAIGTAGSFGNSGNTIANVFDGNLVSYFDAATATGSWVGLDLGTARVATAFRYAPRPSYESRMIGGEIQASNTADFSAGVVALVTITTPPAPGVFNTLTSYNATAYRYYRYIGPAGSFCDIAELELDG